MPIFTTQAAGAALAASLVAASAALAQAPAAAPAPAAPAAKPALSDKAQIERLWAGWNRGFKAHDAAKVMTAYARQGLFVFDVIPPRAYVGFAAYKTDFEGLFEAFPGPLESKITDVAITVVGDVAYSHSVDEAVFTAKDGTKMPLNVRMTDVYRKIGGQWKIVQEHISVPVDLMTGKPDMLSKP